jgi:hypothetical protein
MELPIAPGLRPGAAVRRETHFCLYSSMPWRSWIIWSMLALLPLRGWAVTTMEMPAAVDDAPTHQAAAEQPSVQLNAPCHDGADESDAGSSGHACALCDLCHSAAASAPQFAPPPVLPPGAAPPTVAARDTGRHAIGGLDRPPRSVLT